MVAETVPGTNIALDAELKGPSSVPLKPSRECQQLSRRQFSGAVAGGVSAAVFPAIAGFCRHASAKPTATLGLGDIAANKGLLFGSSFSVAELDGGDGADYARIYQRNARVITSELEFKMHTLRPTAGQYDFGPADRLTAFARANAMKVRGHTLIWNDYLPEWVRQLSQRDAARLLEDHVTEVVGRFRGQVYEWDVVNEPIGPWDKLDGNLRGGVFLSALGEAYIEKSFRLAHAADPGARLFLNEAQTETNDENGRIFRDSLLALVRRLLDKNVPLTGVGLQCHLSSKSQYDFPRFAAFLNEFVALGLEISITELDCDDAAFPAPVAARDRAVAELYRQFLDAVLPIRQVKLVTTWQLADEKSWIWYSDVQKRPHAKRRPRPLLYDSAFNEKPAYRALAEAFAGMAPR